MYHKTRLSKNQLEKQINIRYRTVLTSVVSSNKRFWRPVKQLVSNLCLHLQSQLMHVLYFTQLSWLECKATNVVLTALQIPAIWLGCFQAQLDGAVCVSESPCCDRMTRLWTYLFSALYMGSIRQVIKSRYLKAVKNNPHKSKLHRLKKEKVKKQKVAGIRWGQCCFKKQFLWHFFLFDYWNSYMYSLSSM